MEVAVEDDADQFGVSVDDPNLPIGFSSKMFTIISEMPAWLPPVCVDKSEVWRFSVVFIF